MKQSPSLHFLVCSAVLYALSGCSSQPADSGKQDNTTVQETSANTYVEGSDYLLFERVRVVDEKGFADPIEAYSLLLPKGWKQDGEIMWNAPGSSCAGTFSRLNAKSADGKYSLEVYPDVIYAWNTNQELRQFNQSNGSPSPNCGYREPLDAEQYLRDVFVSEELTNAEIVKVEPAQAVVEQMQQSNEKSRRELTQYGAGQIQFTQTAINAEVRWPDGKEGFVVLGVTSVETVVPNTYNGSYDKIYTTQITKRTLFTYPAGEKEQAARQFAVVMGSVRTNPSWGEAVNGFWKDVRQQKQVAHIGRIRAMDDQTRAIGADAIRKGADRLNAMDTEMRSWEARQNAQDRMHTNFIKTIRGVENYQDASGKVELTSAYDHAWSRGDGSTFIMSNNPAFDPATVLQDQNWKEMKKVD